MSPRTIEQFDKIRKDRKKEILDAALELFGNQGYAQTSISAIAKAAGVSKGLMYNYFESKEDLLKGVVVQVSDETMALFTDLLTMEDSNEILKQMIIRTGDFLKEKREYNTIITSLALQKEVHSFIKDFAHQKMAEMMPFFENLLERQGFENADEEVIIFGATIDGMSIQYLSTENDEWLDKTLQILLKRYTK